jgi:hypothetical protein
MGATLTWGQGRSTTNAVAQPYLIMQGQYLLGKHINVLQNIHIVYEREGSHGRGVHLLKNLGDESMAYSLIRVMPDSQQQRKHGAPTLEKAGSLYSP